MRFKGFNGPALDDLALSTAERFQRVYQVTRRGSKLELMHKAPAK